ncbi:hypothetical protein BDQ17DRAFT_1545311 [Cyathus striatus]|nr:hypothetical protein BDQ17DRAFT_1545311 [Cyathus striatus]
MQRLTFLNTGSGKRRARPESPYLTTPPLCGPVILRLPTTTTSSSESPQPLTFSPILLRACDMDPNTSSISQESQFNSHLSKLGSLFRRGGHKILKRLSSTAKWPRVSKRAITTRHSTRSNSTNSTLPSHLTSYIESENEHDYTSSYDFTSPNSNNGHEQGGEAAVDDDGSIGRLRRVASLRSVRWSCDITR